MGEHILCKVNSHIHVHMRYNIRKCTFRHVHPVKILIVKIDHEIFSTVILSLLLIQEGQLSVSGERMYTKYSLTALRSKPVQKKIWLGKLTVFNITLMG